MENGRGHPSNAVNALLIPPAEAPDHFPAAPLTDTSDDDLWDNALEQFVAEEEEARANG